MKNVKNIFITKTESEKIINKIKKIRLRVVVFFLTFQ